jgi:hypothetical protein
MAYGYIPPFLTSHNLSKTLPFFLVQNDLSKFFDFPTNHAQKSETDNTSNDFWGVMGLGKERSLVLDIFWGKVKKRGVCIHTSSLAKVDDPQCFSFYPWRIKPTFVELSLMQHCGSSPLDCKDGINIHISGTGVTKYFEPG